MPAGAADARECKDIGDGLWFRLDGKSLVGLEKVSEQDSKYPVYRVAAANYVVVFEFQGHLMAAVSRRFPIAARALKALDFPGVGPALLA